MTLLTSLRWAFTVEGQIFLSLIWPVFSESGGLRSLVTRSFANPLRETCKNLIIHLAARLRVYSGLIPIRSRWTGPLPFLAAQATEFDVFHSRLTGYGYRALRVETGKPDLLSAAIAGIASDEVVPPHS